MGSKNISNCLNFQLTIREKKTQSQNEKKMIMMMTHDITHITTKKTIKINFVL